MSQLMSKLYQVANNMTLMSLRSWVQQSSILFCTIDYDTRNTYFITWWSTNCRDTRDKKRYLKETSVPCYYCIANKSESRLFLPKITKEQKWSPGILHQHPCLIFHLRYPLTKRLMSAKSKTASTLQKEELHFVLMKSTRNSDCLLPFVCQIDRSICHIFWSENINVNPSGLAK
jgi:hypothetical protein